MTNNQADAMREVLETAFRRLGGIPAIARSEGGAQKIIEICVKEFVALAAKTDRDGVIEECIRTPVKLLGGFGGKSDDFLRGFDAGTRAFTDALRALKSAPVKQEGK